MVSVTQKPLSPRSATAVGTIQFSPAQGTSTLLAAAAKKKGDIFAVARVAGILAAKRTSSIIPLCHNIGLEGVEVELLPGEGKVEVICRVECTGRTGVEMEALCGVMGAGLTIYDMCKSVDKGMSLQNVRVVEKRGGKSGTWINGQKI
jgi:cyclic pyranopterin monophosphate synthase